MQSLLLSLAGRRTHAPDVDLDARDLSPEGKDCGVAGPERKRRCKFLLSSLAGRRTGYNNVPATITSNRDPRTNKAVPAAIQCRLITASEHMGNVCEHAGARRHGASEILTVAFGGVAASRTPWSPSPCPCLGLRAGAHPGCALITNPPTHPRRRSWVFSLASCAVEVISPRTLPRSRPASHTGCGYTGSGGGRVVETRRISSGRLTRNNKLVVENPGSPVPPHVPDVDTRDQTEWWKPEVFHQAANKKQ
jgi:hypothetical protein